MGPGAKKNIARRQGTEAESSKTSHLLLIGKCDQLVEGETWFSIHQLTSRMTPLNRAAFSSPLSSLCRTAVTGRPVAIRQFTVSARRESKIGSAAISIPPEVSFDLLPPTIKKGKDDGMPKPFKAVIKGPLGS